MFEFEPPEGFLKNRIILVTGAGSGIGRAVALDYARHGATVILVGRTLKKLEAVYDEIEEAGGPQPAIYPLDLEVPADDQYEQMATVLEQEFGQLHGLCHCAGILGALSPIDHYPSLTWLKVMQINCNGAFMLTRHLLPLMKKSEGGNIIFTSSSVGRQGRAYWGAYSASKFATEALTQILADELDTLNPPIRVNAVNPGGTRTRMRAEAYPGEDPTTLPRPEEVTAPYLYLMGSNITEHGDSIDAQPKKPKA